MFSSNATRSHKAESALMYTCSGCLCFFSTSSSALLQARTIYELDDNISRHLYGFDSVEKYYEVSSVSFFHLFGSSYLICLSQSIHFLSHVNVPLLILNALDDPFFAWYVLYVSF